MEHLTATGHPVPVTGYRMTTVIRFVVLLMLVMAGAAAQTFMANGVVSAQEAPAPPVSPAPSTPSARPAPQAPRPPASTDQETSPAPPSAIVTATRPSELRPAPVVRIGQDHVVGAGETVHEVVVIFGSVTIEGHVERDVVVVFGRAHLTSTAVVDRSLVVTAGDVLIEDGAVVRRDLVVTGGKIQAPVSFSPGGGLVSSDLPGMMGSIGSVSPWLTNGLLWGRLIVPDLGWVWAIAGVMVAVYLVLNLLFDRPVRACSQMIAERPLSTSLTGLLVLILLGPMTVILVLSVIGIPVLPFLAFGLIIATLFGKIGVTRWIGNGIVPETESHSRLQSIRSFAIGTVLILLAYMVPILGLLVWAVGSVIGLGAATLAFSSGLRRENPPAPRPAVVPASGSASMPAVSGVAMPPMAADEFRSERTPEPTAFAPVMSSGSSGYSADGSADLLSMPKARFLDRLAAFALDVLLISLTYVLFNLEDGARTFFLLLLGYHVVAWALKGTTVGGAICNLRVIRIDGRPIQLGDALIRGFSSIFSLAALGIGCLWILYDAENQSWHDRFAGTYVVKVPRNWPV